MTQFFCKEIFKWNFIWNVQKRYSISKYDRKINCNLGIDPNICYTILEETITKTKGRYYTDKATVRFNKMKYKSSKGITSGILKSIQIRDNVYKQWKLIHPKSQEYLRA